MWVWGIIDQLEMAEDGSGPASVRVVEQKTRYQPNTPGRCQKRTTALQIMIYRYVATFPRIILSFAFGWQDFGRNGNYVLVVMANRWT